MTEAYEYKELPKGNKRIRLLVLNSASLQTSQIYCELIEVDYGNTFHIPTTLPKGEDSSSQLIKLSPGETDQDELVKEAEVVIEREIKYEALSWCWGVGEEAYAIRIEHDGEVKKLKIRKELALALRYLR
ncbi:hypothetical protein RRF57_006042 [Xylaria bambusicola]|uniref:Uncharacterized protein n=1 Tax=Xylaria bambusicola TaxID=326684 RepID=A0AAN7UKK6_9PEZI